MSKGHKPGRKITDRSSKVLHAAPCDIRERLREAYWNSEADSAKRSNMFEQLHAHERKHGCGPKLANQKTVEVKTTDSQRFPD